MCCSFSRLLRSSGGNQLPPACEAVKYYHLALDQNKELCQAYGCAHGRAESLLVVSIVLINFS